MSLHDLRERIGYVPQKAVLFAETIEENIGMVLQGSWLFSGSIRQNIVYGNRLPQTRR